MSDITISEEALAAKINEAVQKATEPLIGERDALKNKNSEILNEKKTLADKLKGFGDMSPDDVKKLRESLHGNEEAKLIAEGKLDEVVNRRVEKLRTELEAKAQDFEKKYGEEKARAEGLHGKYVQREIDLALSQAAQEAGVQASAIQDVLVRGRGVFSLDEDGSIVARDKDGKLIKIGNEIMNPKNFVQKLKVDAPHFWPGSKGGDLKGAAKDDQLKSAAETGDLSRFRALRKTEDKK